MEVPMRPSTAFQTAAFELANWEDFLTDTHDDPGRRQIFLNGLATSLGKAVRDVGRFRATSPRQGGRTYVSDKAGDRLDALQTNAGPFTATNAAVMNSLRAALGANFANDGRVQVTQTESGQGVTPAYHQYNVNYLGRPYVIQEPVIKSARLLEMGGLADIATPLLGADRYTAFAGNGDLRSFQIYSDKRLSLFGEMVAGELAKRCERDLLQLYSLFGTGRPLPRRLLPIQVFIDAGTFGAAHETPASTDIHCAAFENAHCGQNPELVAMLLVAELAEVFLTWTPKSRRFDGGNCQGEAFSRVIAADLHPTAFADFVTAPFWLRWDSDRDNFVCTDPQPQTDGDLVAVGCTTLFVNYLRSQLGFSLEAILQADGRTFKERYASLYDQFGATRPRLPRDAAAAYADFFDRSAWRFPAHTLIDLTTDNPFPI